MKNLLVFSLLTISAACFAADAKKPITPEEAARRKAGRQRAMLVHTGGWIMRPGVQKGSIAFVDGTSGKIDQSIISNVVATLDKRFHIAIKSVQVKSLPKKGLAEEMKKINANGAIFFCWDEECDLPLIYAPDQQWVRVNVRLLKDGVSDIIYKDRVLKQAVRGFAYVAGSAGSASGEGLMNVTSVRKLDTVEAELMSDVLSSIEGSLRNIGVTPWERVTYIKAVREGWAPSPTNEYQKAIWDEVHALPTEPIKIKPETKKVVD